MKIKRIIDISRRIFPGMTVWPGDGGVQIKREYLIKNGDDCNLSAINMGLHTGTHVDAPFHFLDGGACMESLDLGRFIGLVKVFQLDAANCISEENLSGLPIAEGDVIFFKTSNSMIPETEEFRKDYVYIDKSAALFLAGRKIKTVGVDYLSVGSFDPAVGNPVHKILLSNSIGIIEGLCLKDVKEGTYFFSSLPLHIEGVEGSPVRAVLVEIEE